MTTAVAAENIAKRLTATAHAMPGSIAIAVPKRRKSNGQRTYQTISFRDLDDDSTQIAKAIVELGATPGMRIVLLVRPGIDFVSLTFALFKAGVVVVLIDPGMGRDHMVDCLSAVEPDGFVAIPIAHIARLIHRRRFRAARLNVTVGRRLFWSGPTLQRIRRSHSQCELPTYAARRSSGDHLHDGKYRSAERSTLSSQEFQPSSRSAAGLLFDSAGRSRLAGISALRPF